MIIPHGAKIGPPKRAARERPHNLKRSMGVAGATDTVAGSSTTGSGEGMRPLTCAINGSTLDTEDSDETEEQEVLCELMRAQDAMESV